MFSNATEQQNSGLLINCSAKVKYPPGYYYPDGKEQRIQETVLRASGVREYNADQQRLPMKLSLALILRARR